MLIFIKWEREIGGERVSKRKEREKEREREGGEREGKRGSGHELFGFVSF